MKDTSEPSEWTMKEWHDNPKNWKLGVLYVNSKDNRIFLPNRFYGGWTLNFANPYSIIAIIVIVLILVSLTIIIKH